MLVTATKKVASDRSREVRKDVNRWEIMRLLLFMKCLATSFPKRLTQEEFDLWWRK